MKENKQLTTENFIAFLIALIVGGIMFFCYVKPWIDSLNLFEK